MSASIYPAPLSGIQETITDAKGDIIAATAADTVARLAVGANGTVLTAASGQATGLEWTTPAAGGMTLLSTTTLSGASSITISSISQSYNELHIYIYGVTNATANGVFFCTAYNGATALDSSSFRPNNTSPSFQMSTSSGGRLSSDADNTTSLLRTSSTNFWKVIFTNYTATTQVKSSSIVGTFVNANSDPVAWFNFGGIYPVSSANIDAIVLSQSGGNFSTGTVKIYGVK
jgi:hypothetical protein